MSPRVEASLAAAWVLALLVMSPAARSQSEDLPAWERLWVAGDRVAAVEALERAGAEDPGLRALLAERLMVVHRYAAALTVAESLGPRGAPVAARCLYLLGRHEQALERLDPADPVDTLMRVDALEMLGREAELSAALEAAEAVLGDGHPDLLAARGRMAAAAGDDRAAAASFAKALAADPLHQGARFGLGRAQLRLGSRDEGTATLAEHRRLAPLIDQLDAARRGVDLAPAHAGSLAALGDAERELGRPLRARDAYERAAAVAGPEEVVPVALRHARVLAEDLHDVPAAVVVLDLAARQAPTDARLPVRAGDLLAGIDRRGAAAEHYRAALALRPEDQQILARLAALERDG